MKVVLLLSLLISSMSGNAEELSFALNSKTAPTHELWVTTGFISHHFQTDQHLRNNNAGIGLEYRYSTNSAIATGLFNNSDWQTTHYLAWQYQPLKLGQINIGAVLGLFDGYPKMNNGGLFIAMIPAVSVQYKRLGANLAVVPTYRDRLHGSASLQLKLKLL